MNNTPSELFVLACSSVDERARLDAIKELVNQSEKSPFEAGLYVFMLASDIETRNGNPEILRLRDSAKKKIMTFARKAAEKGEVSSLLALNKEDLFISHFLSTVVELFPIAAGNAIQNAKRYPTSELCMHEVILLKASPLSSDETREEARKIIDSRANHLKGIHIREAEVIQIFGSRPAELDGIEKTPEFEVRDNTDPFELTRRMDMGPTPLTPLAMNFDPDLTPLPPRVVEKERLAKVIQFTPSPPLAVEQSPSPVFELVMRSRFQSGVDLRAQRGKFSWYKEIALGKIDLKIEGKR